MINLALERSYPTPYANSTFLPLLLLSLAGQKNAPNTKTSFQKEYDYIVVGAGAAGSVVASRLSEIPCVNVLLLEAGGAPPLLNDVPGFARYFWGTNLDWHYKSVPLKHTGKGLINEQVIYTSGKGLGGSSLLNAMLYVRGNKKNFDHWAAQGAAGWSYKDVKPYFMKMEDNRDLKYVINGYHGVGGPVTVTKPKYFSLLKNALLEAVGNLGYKLVDSNAFQQTGIYDFQTTARNGQRCSASKAYLVPAENRTNLDIIANAFVKRVVIRGGRAVGVQFDFDGKAYEVAAKKEVILSAGTINTAKLLQLSGIGPKELLKQFDIPVIVDLPVGENFQDHCLVPTAFHLGPQVPNPVQNHDLKSLEEYIRYKTGPLVIPDYVLLLAFLNGASVTPDVDFPNHELFFAQVPSDIVEPQSGLKPDVYNAVFKPYANASTYTCGTQILQPRSKGTVKIQSIIPYDPPLIDPNFFADPRDIDDVIQGMKTCLRIGTNAALQKVGSTPYTSIIPDCIKYLLNIDALLECILRYIVVPDNHHVGTAKMGDPSDPTTVVDPELRVKGVRGLRVVDASVMPIIPSGNTYVPTMMVGEKASDIIKKTIQCNQH